MCRLNPARDVSYIKKGRKHRPLSLEQHEAMLKVRQTAEYRTAHKAGCEQASREGRGWHLHTQATKEKISKARTEYLATTGKGGFPNVGWYRVANHMQEVYILRGTWEKSYAEYLNAKGIKWTRGRVILYRTEDGGLHRYTPDFYIIESDTFVEIKGYFSEKDQLKMKLVQEQNPSLKISILRKDELEELGVIL